MNKRKSHEISLKQKRFALCSSFFCLVVYCYPFFLWTLTKGRSHDAGILHRSRLLQQLKEHCNTPDGQPLCIYGDPAYPIRPHLQAPYKHNNLSVSEKDSNKAMSSVRVSVEWVFGEIYNTLLLLITNESQDCSVRSWNNVYNLCTSSQCNDLSLWFIYTFIL